MSGGWLAEHLGLSTNRLRHELADRLDAHYGTPAQNRELARPSLRIINEGTDG